MTDPFGKPAENDEDLLVVDGLDEVDENPWYCPEGDHPAKVIEARKDTSSAGNPMVVVTAMVTSGPAQGKEVTDFWALTPKALFKAKAGLKALGFDVSGPRLQIPVREIEGRECVITVVDDVYNGEKRSKIKKYRSK